MKSNKKTALITGASQGFGLALAEALAVKGWQLLINARHAKALLAAQRHLEQFTKVEAISGDVRDEIHLLQFAERLHELGWQLDLVVNNASTIGVSPQPALLDYEVEAFHNIMHTNVIAPISLLQKVAPFLSDHACILNLSSDAAVQAYEGWGGYGASKAGLDHLTSIFATENPQWRVFAFDPGDMRTALHQAAFPEEDISDRPLPEKVAVPAALQLIIGDFPSGRYEAGQLQVKSALPYPDYLLRK
ncbi:MAG: SDR family oxidoreductase [Bacteroidota bacterium]